MSVFADSSAVVKLYADEAGAEHIREQGSFYVSQLTRVEVAAALWRKNRMGQLDSGATQILLREFDADYLQPDQGRFVPIRVSAELLEAAIDLAAAHGLRAYDAVQLASAAAVRSADPDCTTFAAFDVDLRDAAARIGFRLLPTKV